MPTYQYRCKECDHDFEVVQSFTDDPLEACPECGGRLKKVYGNVGISFKGSGFYKTDSRGSKTSTSTPSAGSESGGTSTEPTKKADATSGDKASTPATPASSGSSTPAGKD